jgi:UDP-galactopyranose mutase
VINYPNDYDYTRVTEFKYLTGQQHPKTSIVYEYPEAEGDPYYPIPCPENATLYAQYKALADVTPGVHFVGRLATYKYYNMDQVVAQALTLYRKVLVPAATVPAQPHRPITNETSAAALAVIAEGNTHPARQSVQSSSAN